MPVIVIDEATDMPGLTGRLLRADASTASHDAAARALRRANPGLDLDDVRPGTVVVVPELHAGLRNIGDILEPGLGATTERVDTQLTGLAGALEAGAERAAAARKRATAALEDPAVRRAIRGDDARKAVVQQLSDRLADEEEAAEQRAQRARDAAAAWTQDLAELRRLWSVDDD